MNTEDHRRIRKGLIDYLTDSENPLDEDSKMIIKLGICTITNENCTLWAEDQVM